MTNATSKDKERKRSLIRAFIALAILIFIAGWLSALVMNSPDDKTKPVPRTKPIPLPAKPTKPDVADQSDSDARLRTERLRHILRLNKSVADKEGRFGFTALSDGFWNETTDTGLIRSFPASQKKDAVPSGINYYSVLANLISEENAAHEQADALRDQGYDTAYVLPVSDPENQTLYAVMLGDYNSQAEAAEQSNRFSQQEKEAAPSFVIYSDPLSAQPLKNYEIVFRETPVLPPYAIRVASYRSLKAAQDGLVRFERNDLSVFIARDSRGKRPWWRVYTGHYATKEEARQDRKAHSKAIRRATGRSDAMVEQLPDNAEKFMIESGGLQED